MRVGISGEQSFDDPPRPLDACFLRFACHQASVAEIRVMHETFKIPVPDQPWTLEGRWNSGTKGAAIAAPPHPLYGGNLDNPVLGALIDGLLADPDRTFD